MRLLVETQGLFNETTNNDDDLCTSYNAVTVIIGLVIKFNQTIKSANRLNPLIRVQRVSQSSILPASRIFASFLAFILYNPLITQRHANPFLPTLQKCATKFSLTRPDCRLVSLRNAHPPTIEQWDDE